ncbi:MAG: hypothetical protein KIT18_04000 [Burkholderiales bacterium]|nr:hypothetical protein [Burkholderiales bacterium]
MMNPRKPAYLKVIAGTDQPCRREEGVSISTLNECPPAPDWLPNGHAIKEWNRLGPILVANKLLTEASVSVLGQLCALHGKLVQLWAAGETPTGHLLAQYRNLVNDFGLPPIANGRLKTSNKPTQTNKFERFKQRPG